MLLDREEGTKGGFNGPWMHVAADSVGFDCGSGDDAAGDYDDDDDGDCMKQKATMMRPAVMGVVMASQVHRSRWKSTLARLAVGPSLL